MSELDLLKRKLEREIAARKSAESLLEAKSLELYETNQQLRALADHTRAIVETAAEGIITYGDSGAIKTFNRSAHRIFGVENAIGQDVRDLFELTEEQMRRLFGEDVDGALMDPESEIVYQLESLELSGLRRGVQFLCEVALSRAMVVESPMFIAVVRDLTKKKQIEARLSQVRNMESVGQLAAGVAHEINTPIQFIGNNIEFLQGAFDDIGSLLDLYNGLQVAMEKSESSSEILHQIKKQIELSDLEFLRKEFPLAISQSLEGIDRVATIVRAMKDFSTPSTATRAAIDVNKSIRTALAISANQFRDVAEIRTNLDETLPTMIGIGGQFNQAILNILTNAAEAMAIHQKTGEGLLEVETRHTDDDIEIRFHDNGCGIPSDVRARIFDPFFTTKEVGKGIGQGLAFVYDVIVNKHAGTVSAQSRNGGGTTVLVTLPTAICEDHFRREHESTLS
ncbi:PAS domain S-box protein [Stieleria sp. JC731]|uniref:sensor histidine kinase n=1 Tax=Pirellulaceae TaxID=2691357 RepID=UPI001E2CABDD|nr:ATP-binding protein [Stieleria sp. JC731]MCC9600443.1 PAS domain S-box protein [Stieleria sp. JC731]